MGFEVNDWVGVISYIQTIFVSDSLWLYGILFLISFGVNSLLVHLFNQFSSLGRSLTDLSAVQSMHEAPTPRVGGLAIVIVALTLFPLSVLINVKASNLVWCLACLIPILAAGLAEDFGHYVRPRWRLAAAVASSAIAIYFFGLTIDRTGILQLDLVFAFTPIAIAFTLFATVGVVNAFNLIDGLNGLAAMTAIGISISLSVVANAAAHQELARTTFLIVPLLLGFLMLNYPFGKIFLGDAGAYTIGFTLACVALYLFSLSVTISPFAMILIFFWPVADTLLAVWRRASRGKNSANPDRLHFHHLAMRWLQIKARLPKRIANPVATLILMPLVFVPQAIGVLTWDNFEYSLTAVICCVTIFIISYRFGIRSGKSRKSKLKYPKTLPKRHKEFGHNL